MARGRTSRAGIVADIAGVVQNEFIEEAEDSLRLPAFYSLLHSNQFHKVVSGAGREPPRAQTDVMLHLFR